jgi:hypothetical protein
MQQNDLSEADTALLLAAVITVRKPVPAFKYSADLRAASYP